MNHASEDRGHGACGSLLQNLVCPAWLAAVAPLQERVGLLRAGRMQAMLRKGAAALAQLVPAPGSHPTAAGPCWVVGAGAPGPCWQLPLGMRTYCRSGRRAGARGV